MKFLVFSSIPIGILGGLLLAASGTATVSAFLSETDYWFSFAIWLAFLSSWRGSPALRSHLKAIPLRTAIGFAAIIALALVSGKPGYRITNDELVIASTAKSMHLERIAAPMANRFEVDGQTFAQFSHPDKRPSAYPFLVSVMHDLTGYRSLNPFLVNYTLAAIFLLASATLLYRACGDSHAGILFLIVLLSSPLYTQIVFGGLIESTNLLAILSIAVGIGLYSRDPSAGNQDILIYSTVLAANSRYESGLFVLVTGIVVLRSWILRKQFVPSTGVFLAPILMLAPLAHVLLYTKLPYHWQLADGLESPFGLEFVFFNLGGLVRLLTNNGEVYFLSTFFFVLLALALLVCVPRFKQKRNNASELALQFPLIAIGFTILLGLLPTFFYFWGDLSDREASRISISLVVMIVFISALGFGRNASRCIRFGSSCLALLYFWMVGLPNSIGGDPYFRGDHPSSVRFEEDVLSTFDPQDLVIAGLAGILQNASSLSAMDPNYDLRSLRILANLGIIKDIYLVRRVHNYGLPHHDVEALGIRETVELRRSFADDIHVGISQIEFEPSPADEKWIAGIPLPLSLENRSALNLHILKRLVQADFLRDAN